MELITKQSGVKLTEAHRLSGQFPWHKDGYGTQFAHFSTIAIVNTLIYHFRAMQCPLQKIFFLSTNGCYGRGSKKKLHKRKKKCVRLWNQFKMAFLI